MSEPQFDPTGALRFDLERGKLTLTGAGPRLLVPVPALAALLASAGEPAAREFGVAMGTEIGRRLAERLDGALDQLGLESFLAHLAGEFALVGLGEVGLERWGQALVCTLLGNPGLPPVVIAAVFEACLQRGLSRDAAVVLAESDSEKIRLLVLSRTTAQEVRAWLTLGVAFSEIVARLHEPRTKEQAS